MKNIKTIRIILCLLLLSPLIAARVSVDSNVEALSQLEIVKISAGNSNHFCALLSDNSIRCWGNNDSGQLGLGDTATRGDNENEMSYQLPPVNIGAGVVDDLVVGGTFTCVLIDGGKVRCWGRNESGQLGLGDVANRGDQQDEMGSSLQDIDFGTNRTVKQLALGSTHGCAILDNDTVKCWGNNGNGNLGVGDLDSRGDQPNEMGDFLPTVDLGTQLKVTKLTAGERHTCALFETGAIKCWGYNNFGQLGLEDDRNRGSSQSDMGSNLPFVNIGSGTTAIDLSAGQNHTCALTATNAVKCWGTNRFQTLGTNDTYEYGRHVGSMGSGLPTVSSNVREIVAGALQTCVIKIDGASTCWGGVYTNTSIEYQSPRVFTLHQIDKIVQSHGSSCGLTITKVLKCWGYNSSGALGIGNTNFVGENPQTVILFDATPPAIESISLYSSSGSDLHYKKDDIIRIKVTFTENLVISGASTLSVRVGSNIADFSFNSSIDSKTLEYVYSVTSADEDLDGLSIDANSLILGTGASITDLANNNALLSHSAVSTQSNHKVDGKPATLSWTAPSTVSSSPQISFAIDFNEGVTGLTVNDLEFVRNPNCLIQSVTGSGASWLLNIQCSSDGPVEMRLKKESVSDRAGNLSPAEAESSPSITVDTTIPTFTWTPISDISDSRTITFPFNTSANATELTELDLTLTGTAEQCSLDITNSNGNGSVLVTCFSDGTVQLTLAANSLENNIGTVGPVSDVSTQVITIDTSPSPPSGEIGLSINQDAAFTNSKEVTLSIVWPKGATQMKISNDGSFNAGTTTVTNVGKTLNWSLRDEIKGLYTRIVYIRFVGHNINSSITYSDDIVFDSLAPLTEVLSAQISDGKLSVELQSTDDVSGVNAIEISDVNQTASLPYKPTFSVNLSEVFPQKDLDPTAGPLQFSMSLRTSDKAGNWSSWQKLPFNSLVLQIKKSIRTKPQTKLTNTEIARRAKISLPKGHKVTSVILPNSKKICRSNKKAILILKRGSCHLNLRVESKAHPTTIYSLTLRGN